MTEAPTATGGDLATCDSEPIRVPGSIQPHGALLALREPSLEVMQASANAASILGREVPPGASLEELFGPEGAALRAGLAAPALERGPLCLRTVGVGRRWFRAVAHRRAGAAILELEPTASGDEAGFRDLYPLVSSFIAGLEGAGSLEELCRLAAAEARRLAGFHRVLVYRFAEDWSGHVVAESRDGALPSYLGLRFPASDIPRQARELYKLNHLRLIADAGHVPSPLEPALRPDTGEPLDLSLAVLRSVSPIHLEYMRNMGTAASMSFAVLCEGRLWGLVSCHHAQPRIVPFEVRTACELVGQYLGQQVAARERSSEMSQRLRLKDAQADLMAAMAARSDFAEGLACDPSLLLGFAGAAGAAILADGACRLVGDAPDEAAARALADWLAASAGDVFACDDLPSRFPEAAGWDGRACGLLAVRLSKLHRSYLMWFRPEAVRTVAWGGDPAKPAQQQGERLHPRRSFDLWKETVRGRSLPWSAAEPPAAADLRNDIVGILLRQAEEKAQLAAELRRANEELESFSYSVSHDLRAPFRHIVGYAELLKENEAGRLREDSAEWLDRVLESALYAGTLVDNLLAFSHMSRARLDESRIDLGTLVEEERKELAADAGGRTIIWRVGPLPLVKGDLEMMRLVFRNLLSNAVKYTRTRAEAVIEVGCESDDREHVVQVRDNGVGFDMRYVGKLFGVFQRLHRIEEFEGTGIGLANVRRIVSRHGGRAWAEGEPDKGAAFFVALPRLEG